MQARGQTPGHAGGTGRPGESSRTSATGSGGGGNTGGSSRGGKAGGSRKQGQSVQLRTQAGPSRGPRKLVVSVDGTSLDESSASDSSQHASNVLKIHRMMKCAPNVQAYYHAGPGADLEEGRIRASRNAATGAGE